MSKFNNTRKSDGDQYEYKFKKEHIKEVLKAEKLADFPSYGGIKQNSWVVTTFRLHPTVVEMLHNFSDNKGIPKEDIVTLALQKAFQLVTDKKLFLPKEPNEDIFS